MLRIKQTVQVNQIPQLMSLLLLDLNIWSTLEGKDLTITGWQDKTYRPGGAHRQGRAVDVRTTDLEPEQLTSLVKHLKAREYPLLVGAPDHYDHIHVQTDGKCR